MSTAVVTGGHGFIGRRAVDALTQAGWTAVAAGRPDEEIPSAAFTALLATYAPDLVVHCASPASVGGSVEDPHGDLLGSVAVLSALLDELGRFARPPRLLLVSSAAVYGQPERLPVEETAAVAPVSPYGLHRAMCESLLAGRAAAAGVPFAIARVFSAYGEGLRRQLLWDVCRRAVAGPVTLSGTGAETRDFLHVDDVARALVAMAGRSAFGGEVVNVASGAATSVAHVATSLVTALGRPADTVRFDGSIRPGDPSAWQADVGRLAALDFTPSVPIDAGLERYAAWAAAELRVAT